MSAQRSSSNYATTKTAIIFISLFAIFTLLLSACGGGGSSSSTKNADTLWIGEIGDQYVDNFNPYAGGSGGPPTEMIYESLIFTNLAKSTMNPWLASSWKFSPDNKQLTFTLQNNVKWNDGQPFTADDVAFTLNLMKQYPGMDVSAIWQYLTSVTAPDAHTVVVDFKAISDAARIASNARWIKSIVRGWLVNRLSKVSVGGDSAWILNRSST